jgi:hypothetical protein
MLTLVMCDCWGSSLTFIPFCRISVIFGVIVICSITTLFSRPRTSDGFCINDWFCGGYLKELDCCCDAIDDCRLDPGCRASLGSIVLKSSYSESGC